MPKGYGWEQSRIDTCVKMWDAGHKTKDIADAIGVNLPNMNAYILNHRELFARRERYVRYCDPKLVDIAAGHWAGGMAIGAIRKEMKMGENTFLKMRKYAPKRFPKRDKHNRIGFTMPEVSMTKAKVARRGEGLHLRNGKGYLHLGGETITTDRNIIWRGTHRQALNMIAASNHELTIVPETALNNREG